MKEIMQAIFVSREQLHVGFQQSDNLSISLGISANTFISVQQKTKKVKPGN